MSLTESDLRRLIRSIILEDKNYPKDMDSAVSMMTESFNVLLELSRTPAFDEFCKNMESQIKSGEGTKFCQALRAIPFTTRKLSYKGEEN